MAGKDHFVSGLQSDRVAERFRDHDLPFAADTMSHTIEYNFERDSFVGMSLWRRGTDAFLTD